MLEPEGKGIMATPMLTPDPLPRLAQLEGGYAPIELAENGLEETNLMCESPYILIRRGCRVDCTMKGIWRRRFYPLSPRAYQLLMYFVTHANSVVAEEDLIRTGWPERGPPGRISILTSISCDSVLSRILDIRGGW